MTATPVLEAALVEIAADARRDRRARLRARAAEYERSAWDLFHWTSLQTRDAIRHAIENPASMAATKALCKALYSDLRFAIASPRWHVNRTLTIRERRLLFACECELYRRQRNTYRRETMKGFFDNVVKPIGEKPEAAE